MRIAISLFLVTAAVYLFSTGAHAYSVDETTNYASARAFVQTGSPDLRSQIDNPFPSTRLLKVEHPDQPRITGRYGLLAWLSMVPAYAAASAFGPVPEPVGPAFPQGGDILPLAGLLFNPLIGATLVALIYLLARSVALSRWHSLAAAIIAGFASPIWVYSSTLSSIPLATTLIIAALLALARGRQRHQIALALSSGLLAGLAAATRPDFILFAPILLIAAFAIRPQPVGAAVARAALWAVGWAIVVVPGVGFYNLYRTGDVLNFGYSEQTFLWATDRAHIGLFGILASSGFGLFVYFPLGILGLWGLLTGGGVRWLRWTMAAATLMAILQRLGGGGLLGPALPHLYCSTPRNRRRLPVGRSAGFPPGPTWRGLPCGLGRRRIRPRHTLRLSARLAKPLGRWRQAGPDHLGSPFLAHRSPLAAASTVARRTHRARFLSRPEARSLDGAGADRRIGRHPYGDRRRPGSRPSVRRNPAGLKTTRDRLSPRNLNSATDMEHGCGTAATSLLVAPAASCIIWVRREKMQRSRALRFLHLNN